MRLVDLESSKPRLSYALCQVSVTMHNAPTTRHGMFAFAVYLRLLCSLPCQSDRLVALNVEYCI